MSGLLENLKKNVSSLSDDEALNTEKVVTKYAEHLDELFALLIPEKIGDDYKKALEASDVDALVKTAAKYFRERPDSTLFSANGRYNQTTAENTVKGIMREVNVDWQFPDAHVDFLFDATTVLPPRNHEWLWQLNRHGFWAETAKAWVSTKDSKYSLALRRQMLDWIAFTGVVPNWNGPGSAWRTIECGLRLMGSWLVAFEGIRKAPEIPDALVLLLVASMHRQAKHLVEHPTGGNWLMMESDGTFSYASVFPELSDSAEYRKIAADRLLEEMKKQILPDGMHNELSPDYHGVVLHCATSFYNVACAQGQADEFPEEFVKLMKDMVNAGIWLSTPAFTQPRTNDCYTIFTRTYTGRAENLLGNNPEYKFVNSVRKEGEPPKGETASAYLPYAGFAAMRSDWGEDATYMCFDVGTLGMGHWHQDKLNINIFKGNEELLHDDGGGQYEISPARNYGISSYAHNLVLVDGKGQTRKGPKQVTEPIDAGWITNDTFDYAFGVYDDVYGETKPATHKREVRFVKPGFFAVKDILTSSDEAAHEYEILFHMDTTKTKAVKEYKNAVVSDFGKKYDLLIVPVGGEGESEPIAVSAQNEPFQGWYNGRNAENLHPAVTVSRKANGKDHVFRTLLIPVKSGEPLPEIKIDGNIATVTLDGKAYAVDFDNLNK